MKNLEQEAKEYSVEQNKLKGFYVDLDESKVYSQKDFIAGANSKWVQAEKIKAQMECLNRAKDLDIQTVYLELKKQLKQLEDETKI